MTVLLVVLLVLLICLISGMPIYGALLLSGLIGLLLNDGLASTISVLGAVPFQAVSHQALVVIPLYLLMGTAIFHSGATTDLFAFARLATRRIPGGLGVATVLTGGGLASVTGSSVASTALMSKIAYPHLEADGYDRRFAAGLVAAIGTLGVLIPPSIMLVMYGIAAQESIRRLLIAGILPGILTIVVFILTIFFFEWRRRRQSESQGAARAQQNVGVPADTQRVQNLEEFQAEASVRNSLRALLPSVFMIAGTFLVAIGGLYLGWFTSVESGAVGVVLAYLILLSRRSAGGLSRVQRAMLALQEALSIAGMIFMLYMCAAVFGYFLTSSALPAELVRSIIAIEGLSNWFLLALLSILLLPMGMFLDGLTIILVTVPLIYPVVQAFEFDGVWYGIIMVKLIEIGLITPPVGLNAFAVAGTQSTVRAEDVFLGVRPFLIAELIVTAILFAVPGIVTFLPNMMQ